MFPRILGTGQKRWNMHVPQGSGECSPEKLGIDPKEMVGTVPQGTGFWAKEVDRHVPQGSGDLGPKGSGKCSPG